MRSETSRAVATTQAATRSLLFPPFTTSSLPPAYLYGVPSLRNLFDRRLVGVQTRPPLAHQPHLCIYFYFLHSRRLFQGGQQPSTAAAPGRSSSSRQEQQQEPNRNHSMQWTRQEALGFVTVYVTTEEAALPLDVGPTPRQHPRLRGVRCTECFGTSKKRLINNVRTDETKQTPVPSLTHKRQSLYKEPNPSFSRYPKERLAHANLADNLSLVFPEHLPPSGGSKRIQELGSAALKGARINTPRLSCRSVGVFRVLKPPRSCILPRTFANRPHSTVPASASSTPAMRLNSVVLPDPFGPTCE